MRVAMATQILPPKSPAPQFTTSPKDASVREINAMELEVAVQRAARRPGLPCLLCVVLRGPGDGCVSRAPEVALYIAICLLETW